jgi:4-hydroxybenzoate polyprenyltransferase
MGSSASRSEPVVDRLLGPGGSVGVASVAAPLTLPRLLWGASASTIHRVWLGEGALLAINASLIFVAQMPLLQACGVMAMSTITLALMYMLNDLYDAPADRCNPKKDQQLVALYLDYAHVWYPLVFALKGLAILAAWQLMGAPAAWAVPAVLVVNIVYSFGLKGVPIVDVAWCGVWGACYAAIAAPSAYLLILVGLMTAICHLFQALGDATTDAANRITTTAVFSRPVSALVLVALSGAIFEMLQAPLGTPLALSAFVPVGFFYLFTRSHWAWLATKAYFAVMWVIVLGQVYAAG